MEGDCFDLHEPPARLRNLADLDFALACATRADEYLQQAVTTTIDDWRAECVALAGHLVREVITALTCGRT